MPVTFDPEPTGTITDMHWADDAGAPKTEPTELYKTNGFQASTAPSVHAMNWALRFIMLWLAWLKSSINAIKNGMVDKNDDIIPTPTDQWVIGGPDNRYAEIHAEAVYADDIVTTKVGNGVNPVALVSELIFSAGSALGSTIPIDSTNHNQYNIGQEFGKLKRIYVNEIQGDIETTFYKSIVPATSAVYLGKTSARFVNGYINTVIHGSNPAATMGLGQIVLACGSISSNGTKLPGFHNIADAGISAKTDDGEYNIRFINPVKSSGRTPAVLVSLQAGTTGDRITYNWVADNEIVVYVYDLGGTGSVDSAFSFVIMGSADF